jgi:hypothetical protein
VGAESLVFPHAQQYYLSNPHGNRIRTRYYYSSRHASDAGHRRRNDQIANCTECLTEEEFGGEDKIHKEDLITVFHQMGMAYETEKVLSSNRTSLGTLKPPSFHSLLANLSA